MMRVHKDGSLRGLVPRGRCVTIHPSRSRIVTILRQMPQPHLIESIRFRRAYGIRHWVRIGVTDM